jgi:RNA polymerase sigma-70 factor (ECF subfamily)
MKKSTTKVSEAELVRQVLDGRHNSFNQLVDRYYSYVLNLARRYTNCEQQATEITQDTFVRAYEKLGSFKGESSFSTWLYPILRTTALNALAKAEQQRKNQKNLARRAPVSAAEWGSTERVEHRLDQTLIHQALQELSPIDKAVLSLYYMEERSVGEVSAALGFSKVNIKTKLHRARNRMKDLLLRKYGSEIQFIYQA